MKSGQMALHALRQSPRASESTGFLTAIIMATHQRVMIDDEQEEFLSLLVFELIETGNTTAVEARNTATWLNTLTRD